MKDTRIAIIIADIKGFVEDLVKNKQPFYTKVIPDHVDVNFDGTVYRLTCYDAKQQVSYTKTFDKDIDADRLTYGIAKCLVEIESK